MITEKRYYENWEVELVWIEGSEQEANERVVRLIKCLLQFDESASLAENSHTFSEEKAA